MTVLLYSGDKWGHKGKKTETPWNNDLHHKNLLINENHFFEQLQNGSIGKVIRVRVRRVSRNREESPHIFLSHRNRDRASAAADHQGP